MDISVPGEDKRPNGSSWTVNKGNGNVQYIELAYL